MKINAVAIFFFKKGVWKYMSNVSVMQPEVWIVNETGYNRFELETYI